MEIEKTISKIKQSVDAQMKGALDDLAAIEKRIASVKTQADGFRQKAEAKRKEADAVKPEIDVVLGKGGDPLSLSRKMRDLLSDAADYDSMAVKIEAEQLSALQKDLKENKKAVADVFSTVLVSGKSALDDEIRKGLEAICLFDRAWNDFAQDMITAYGQDMNPMCCRLNIPTWFNRSFMPSEANFV